MSAGIVNQTLVKKNGETIPNIGEAIPRGENMVMASIFGQIDPDMKVSGRITAFMDM